MGAEGRFDLQLADNETTAAVATAAATPQEEGQSSVQNEQQQQEVWLKYTYAKFICMYLLYVHYSFHIDNCNNTTVFVCVTRYGVFLIHASKF